MKEEPFVVLGIILCLAAFVFVVVAMFFGWQDFMTQCMQDHKQYECSIMYQGGVIIKDGQ